MSERVSERGREGGRAVYASYRPLGGAKGGAGPAGAGSCGQSPGWAGAAAAGRQGTGDGGACPRGAAAQVGPSPAAAPSRAAWPVDRPERGGARARLGEAAGGVRGLASVGPRARCHRPGAGRR